MKKSIKHVKSLIAASAACTNDNDGAQAMKLSQAAVNSANALAVIQEVIRNEG
jgi:hypothetical protein